MEHPRRERGDINLPDGAFREEVDELRRIGDARELAIGIVDDRDFRTRVRKRARPSLVEPYLLEMRNEQETACGKPGLRRHRRAA